MRRLYLIRHGQTAWNAERRNQGQTDIPLDDVGLAQARRVADRLSGEHIDALYASDLSRAAETARVVGAAIGREPVLDPDLREIYCGSLQGLTHDEVEARWPGLYAGYRETGPPDGETLEEVEERMVAALERVRASHADGVVAVVGHGFSMSLLVGRMLGVPRAERSPHAPRQSTSITLLEFGAGAPAVLISNCGRHLTAGQSPAG